MEINDAVGSTRRGPLKGLNTDITLVYSFSCLSVGIQSNRRTKLTHITVVWVKLNIMLLFVSSFSPPTSLQIVFPLFKITSWYSSHVLDEAGESTHEYIFNAYCEVLMNHFYLFIAIFFMKKDNKITCIFKVNYILLVNDIRRKT